MCDLTMAVFTILNNELATKPYTWGMPAIRLCAEKVDTFHEMACI